MFPWPDIETTNDVTNGRCAEYLGEPIWKKIIFLQFHLVAVVEEKWHNSLLIFKGKSLYCSTYFIIFYIINIATGSFIFCILSTISISTLSVLHIALSWILNIFSSLIFFQAAYLQNDLYLGSVRCITSYREPILISVLQKCVLGESDLFSESLSSVLNKTRLHNRSTA